MLAIGRIAWGTFLEQEKGSGHQRRVTEEELHGGDGKGETSA